MLSYHTCPLATLGGKDTGGMNVYVRDLTRTLGSLGVHVDVFTRSQDEHVPHVLHDLGYGNRVVHIKAGEEVPLPKEEMLNHIPEFTAGIEEFANLNHAGRIGNRHPRLIAIDLWIGINPETAELRIIGDDLTTLANTGALDNPHLLANQFDRTRIDQMLLQ